MKMVVVDMTVATAVYDTISSQSKSQRKLCKVHSRFREECITLYIETNIICYQENESENDFSDARSLGNHKNEGRVIKCTSRTGDPKLGPHICMTMQDRLMGLSPTDLVPHVLLHL